MPSDHHDASRPDDSEPGLDIDAAFAEIVAHWVPSPPSPEVEEPDGLPGRAVLWDSGLPRAEERERRTPEPDALPEAPRDDEEEHYVPPPPPPLPKLEPRRKLAWTGLFGAPVVGMVLIILGVVVPGWVVLGLVAAFVGGFGYLVATMGSSPPDPWSGDDGAVL